MKKNTYANSNVTSAVNNVVAVVFTGGEDITPTLYRVLQEWRGPEKDKVFNATRDISDYLLMSYCIDNLGSSTKRNRGEEFEPGGFADCL